MPVRKGRQKGLRVSSFALLWIVFKRHYGSEGVKTGFCHDQAQKDLGESVNMCTPSRLFPLTARHTDMFREKVSEAP